MEAKYILCLFLLASSFVFAIPPYYTQEHWDELDAQTQREIEVWDQRARDLYGAGYSEGYAKARAEDIGLGELLASNGIGKDHPQRKAWIRQHGMSYLGHISGYAYAAELDYDLAAREHCLMQAERGEEVYCYPAECQDEYLKYKAAKDKLERDTADRPSGYSSPYYAPYIEAYNDVTDCLCPISGGCPPQHCYNGVQDGDEEGIDCGGVCARWGMWLKSCPDCTNGISDIDETGIDCGGPDCEPCEDGMRLIPPEGPIDADGEMRFIIFADVKQGGQPKQGETVYFSLRKESGPWDDEIGEFVDNSDVTDANGRAMIEYIPPFIITAELESDEPIKIEIKAETGGWFGASATGHYTLKPLDLNVSVKKIVPVQALASLPSNKIPMVSGKKTAVMVALEASKPDVFWPHENIRFFLDFDAGALNEMGWQEKGFDPGGYRIMLEEPSPSVEVIEGDHVDEYLSLMKVEKEDGKIYKVYIFYLDHKKTDLNGHYTFEGRIIYKRFNPKTNTWKEKDLGGKKVKVKTYPSKPLRLKIVPVGLGVWHPDVCDFCVKPKFWGGYEFICTDGHKVNYQIGNVFDWEWEGRLDIDKVNAALQNARGPKAKVCKDGFAQYYPQTVLNDLASRQPAKTNTYAGSNNPMTPKERYYALATESIEYFKAVMPIAEENIRYEIVDKPQDIPLLGARESWPSLTLSAVNRVYGAGRLVTSTYYRVVGIVPIDPSSGSRAGTGFSLLDMDAEGYMSGIYGDESVLINHFYAGTTVMTHEIAHTYCAIDEYENVIMRAIKAGIVVPLTCQKGKIWINSNKGSGPEGTPVTTGFWVEKRKLMGTPTNPKYSFMGNATVGNRWVTEELYFGIGSNLKIFPMFKSSWEDDE